MSARNKDSNINLLPQSSFNASTGGRVLTWILSTFRTIVIVTEIIVMIAFLSRFWLDAQNSDLTEELEIKVAALEATQPFEKEYKDVQKRLLVFSGLTQKDATMTSLIQQISDHLPVRDDFKLSSITYNESKITIEGVAINEIDIQQYISNLQSNPLLQNASISKVETKENNELIMEFTIEIIRSAPSPVPDRAV